MTTAAIQPIQVAGTFSPNTQKESIKVSENTLNGLYPFFFGGFLDFKKKDGRSTKATIITPPDFESLKNVNTINELIKTGGLIGVLYKQGTIESICVHSELFNQIQEKKALDLVCKNRNQYILKTLENQHISIAKLDAPSYLGMIKHFFEKKQ